MKPSNCSKKTQVEFLCNPVVGDVDTHSFILETLRAKQQRPHCGQHRHSPCSHRVTG